MKTVIMTVGTSLLHNQDKELAPASRRPWLGTGAIGDRQAAAAWLGGCRDELASAETNTLWRLNPAPHDEIRLLHSDTPEGRDCAEALKVYWQSGGQEDVRLCRLPGIHYDGDAQPPALEQMASLLGRLIDDARGAVTLAATGGFKAQVMIMALVGNARGVPVCYVHEQYRALVYLPYLGVAGPVASTRAAPLPAAAAPRDAASLIQLSASEHHRPSSWPRVARMLVGVPWIEAVRYDPRAGSAPRDGVKASPHRSRSGRQMIWMHLAADANGLPLAIETTGTTTEHLEEAEAELRERLGRLL